MQFIPQIVNSSIHDLDTITQMLSLEAAEIVPEKQVTAITRDIFDC
jgi:hypothetical protein